MKQKTVIFNGREALIKDLKKRRDQTICGSLTEPADVWADGTHTCSKACGEVKRYNMSILQKGQFSGQSYRSQGARG